jgi:lysophospholipase L1-like esterase
LAATLVVMVVARLWLRLLVPVALLVHTLILLLVLLPVYDLLRRPSYRLQPIPDLAKKFYSYSVARKNPETFAAWWDYFGHQWDQLAERLWVRERTGPLPFRLRPNSEAKFFESRIRINSLGFRGREFPLNKGDAYRIIVLGESTTFGCTMQAEDRPWPEVLERLIQERLHPRRPVEVINAGVFGWSIQENLFRLPTDILPLKPDLLISYHGINGFSLLDDSIPPLSAQPPPRYKFRPLKILADAEYGLKLHLYERRFQADSKPRSPSPKVSDPRESRYGRAYCELIEIARTNGIRLALGDFCLAVNAQSDRDVIDFYRAGFPYLQNQARANETHSALVRELAGQHPEVIYIDTHPHLDGEHEKFIDLMHFTQPGRQQLAETFFEGLHEMLKKDLSETRPARTN